MDGLRSLEGSQRAQEQVLCGDPSAPPEKENQSAELEQKTEGGGGDWRGGTGGGRKHSREREPK